MSILKSERFQNDKRQWEEMIEGLTNPTTKNETQRMLTELIQAIKKLDSNHGIASIGGELASRVEDSKNDILSLRKKLDSRLKDYRRSQAQRPAK